MISFSVFFFFFDNDVYGPLIWTPRYERPELIKWCLNHCRIIPVTLKFQRWIFFFENWCYLLNRSCQNTCNYFCSSLYSRLFISCFFPTSIPGPCIFGYVKNLRVVLPTRYLKRKYFKSIISTFRADDREQSVVCFCTEKHTFLTKINEKKHFVS